MRQRRRRGFTLIEVLVALALTATALIAALRASAALTESAGRQSQFMLAQLCAENHLVQLRLARRLPDVGTSGLACAQAGRSFAIEQAVHATPNPYFRRVELQVSEGGQGVVQMSFVAGRN